MTNRYNSGEESRLGDILCPADPHSLPNAKPTDQAVVVEPEDGDDEHADCVYVHWVTPCGQADGGYYPWRFILVHRKDESAYASGELAHVGDIVEVREKVVRLQAGPGSRARVVEVRGRIVSIVWDENTPYDGQCDGGYYADIFHLVRRGGVSMMDAKRGASVCPYAEPQPIPGFEARQLLDVPTIKKYKGGYYNRDVPIYDQPRSSLVEEQSEKFRLDVVRNLREVPCCTHHNKLVNIEIVVSISGVMTARFRCPYCHK